MTDFTDITYLANGSAVQQRIYALLQQTKILNFLAEFDPVVIGTFPLDIQTETSDLDIACHAPDLEDFSAKVEAVFGDHYDFKIRQISIRNEYAVVANFSINKQPFEIFGQTKPATLQMGYLHMLAEHHLLQQHGAAFKQAIINLKKQGIKTEPAFCQLLGIEGDPYLELLRFCSVPY